MPVPSSILEWINAALWLVAAAAALVGLVRLLRPPRARGLEVVAFVLAFAIVSLDVAVVRAISDLDEVWQWARMVPSLVLLPVLAMAVGGWRALGFRRPEQSLGYWLTVTALFGAVGSLLAGVGIIILATIEWSAPIARPPLASFAMSALVIAPIVEEVIYRLALVFPIERGLGKWAAITTSGLVFAAIHYVYGNPGIDNFIGGYILAWSYIKSRSIIVPVVLHALGNGFIYAVLVAFEVLL